MFANYAVLHAHLTNGSVGDSTLRTKDYVAKAKGLGLQYIAMTDHGSLSAMYDFYEETKNAGITGIIGMEAYVAEDRMVKNSSTEFKYSHLILLAKNKDGVKNLLRIHNDAQLTGFYYKPRTDLSVLKKYGKNIIATSACVAGAIPQAIIAKDFVKAEELIKEYAACFDEFYLEIQPGRFPEQILVNRALVAFNMKLHIPLVVTNDIHYLNSEDYLMHNIHVMSYRKQKQDSAENQLIYPDTCYYLMSREELKNRFVKDNLVTDKVLDEALDNTIKIAEQCDEGIEFGFQMPKFIGLPEGYTDKSYIAELCWNELNKRIQKLNSPQSYVDRLEYELDTIDKLGFNGYFLIVRDFLNYAREHKIAVGPGRGSCVASIVSWLLNITVADPIKYNLMFERFLSPNRKGYPDIDVDIMSDRRAELQEYVIHKYGKENCAFVGTFGVRKAKDAIRSAGRYLNMDLEIVDQIAKAFPKTFYDDDGEKNTDPSIAEYVASTPALQQFQKLYPELFKAGEDMESYIKSIGVHAAGMVINPTGLADKIPLRWYDKDKDTKFIATTLTKETVEKQALKFDFLALRTIGVIEQTLDDAKVKIDLSDDAFFADDKVWALIGSANSAGLFQIGSYTYKKRMSRLKPKNINELAACLALVRSPCISTHQDEIYMQICEGKRTIEKIHPLYDSITEETNGIAIFQEQIMQIAMAMGFSADEGYSLFKLISKKKVEKLKAMKETFYSKATDKGIELPTIDKIWNIILAAGLYSFNRGHAVAYAIVCYISAWLKTYFPKEFMANLLTNVYTGSNDYKVKEAVADVKRLGIKILPPDINKSQWKFIAEDIGIRVGFCAIKSFGEKAAAGIVAAQPFNDFDDFIEKKNGTVVRKPSIIVAIMSGCFDCFVDDRTVLLQHYSEIRGDKEVLPEEIKICKNTEIKLTDSKKTLEKILLGGNNLVY